jgi:hypothetical protein
LPRVQINFVPTDEFMSTPKKHHNTGAFAQGSEQGSAQVTLSKEALRVCKVRRLPDYACSDFTPQPRREADVTVPYWPADLAVDVDRAIPYRLTEQAPHYADMPSRAREAGL